LRSNGEDEVGLGGRSGIPHLTPTLSAPPMDQRGGGEGVICYFPHLGYCGPAAAACAAAKARNFGGSKMLACFRRSAAC
jgi:hypothetical protein